MQVLVMPGADAKFDRPFHYVVSKSRAGALGESRRSAAPFVRYVTRGPDSGAAERPRHGARVHNLAEDAMRAFVRCGRSRSFGQHQYGNAQPHLSLCPDKTA